MLPDCSDWYARKPSGTRKNTASHATPGASSRYGVSPRWRWKKFTDASAGDQVLPLRQVLLVVERLVCKNLPLSQLLFFREIKVVFPTGEGSLLARSPRPRPRG